MTTETRKWCVIVDVGERAMIMPSGNLVNAQVYPIDGGLVVNELALNYGTPVFECGELLLINEHGREICGAGRKPDKWAVDYETFPFAELEIAIKRARESVGVSA